MIPGAPGRPLPPRQKAYSQPDAEVPESVFGAILAVQRDVQALAGEVRAGKADTDVKIAEVKELAQKAGAAAVERWTNLAKALVPAVVAIVGGTYGVQKLTAPSAPPPEVRAVRSAEDLALDECRPLQPGSYERAECFERVSSVPAGRRRR